MRLLLTCEHASNRVPARWVHLFPEPSVVLTTHRAWDPGARDLARRLSSQLQAPLVLGRISRLLVELNRSLHHPRLWSEFSQKLPRSDRQWIVDHYYEPHRQSVREHIHRLARHRNTVLHIGVHSFTPVLHGQVRQTDVGLLYNPARPREAAFARHWQQSLANLGPQFRVRRNYPYQGKADGLVTWLRHEFSPSAYLGIELEVNQAFPLGNPTRWQTLQNTLTLTLEAILG